jgi:hypothetical protein
MDVFNKMVKLLDSADMSLDLIYGALTGGGSPIAATRFRQRQMGRLARPMATKA